MKHATLIAGAAAAAFTFFPAVSAQAGPSEEIIQLSHRMEREIAHLKEDFQVHYRWTWQYAGLLNLLAQVETTNEVVHGLSHDSLAGATVLERNIEKLDGQVHDLHDAVDDVEAGASASKVRGNTAAVHAHLRDMTGILHRMEDIAEARVAHFHARNRHHGHGHGHHQPQQQLQVIRTPFGYIQLNQNQQVTTSNQWQNTPNQTQPHTYPQNQQHPRTYPQNQLPANNGNSIFDRLRNKLRNR